MNASQFQVTGRAATKSKQTITVKMRVPDASTAQWKSMTRRMRTPSAKLRKLCFPTPISVNSLTSTVRPSVSKTKMDVPTVSERRTER